MTLERTAAIFFGIAITSAIAHGQQSSTSGGRPHTPGTTAVEPTYWAAGPSPVRRTYTQSESDGRKVVVESLQGRDIEGRLATREEVVTETTTQGPDATFTREDVFRMTVNGRQRLAETTESRQDTQPNGDTNAVHSRWLPDLNGRLRLRSQLVEETWSSTADAQQMETTLLLPGLNGALRDAERTEQTTRRIDPGTVRHETHYAVRDVNGRWKPVEVRRGEAREVGTSERVEEETVQRPDLNGNLAVTSVNVTRSSRTADQEQVVIESYAPYLWPRGINGRPPLSGRVQRTTTATADGGRYTVEEVEARSRVSPDSPMRVIRRFETTVSAAGDDRWVTETKVFEPDLNGRMRLVRIE